MQTIPFIRQLEERRGLFFQIGLAVSLFIVWVALQLSFTYTLPEVKAQEEIIEPYIAEKPVAVPTVEAPPVVKPKPAVKQTENTSVIIITASNTETEKPAEQEQKVVESDPVAPPTGNHPSIVIPPVAPEFSGGLEALYSYLRKNIKYDRRAAKEGIAGTVYVRFRIDTEGRVNEAVVVKGVHPWLDEEALRVVSNMPNWIPGKNYDGSPMECYFSLPVAFRLK